MHRAGGGHTNMVGEGGAGHDPGLMEVQHRIPLVALSRGQSVGQFTTFFFFFWDVGATPGSAQG